MSIADELNKENNISKNEFEDYTYVMVSTLNQMVNYIPYEIFDFKEVYNITIEDSKKNEKWDNNIKKFVKVDKTIAFNQTEILKINTIKERLKKELSEKKVFWNITGGQKAFVLAISQIAKKDDMICYLEGNTNQMVLLNYKKHDYCLDNLDINTALRLMNFEVKETITSQRDLVKNYDKEEKEFYLKLYDLYTKDKELRKHFIISNKQEKKDTIKKEILDKLKKEIDTSNFEKELDKNMSFGYILEKLAGYKIFEIVKDKIADISFGEKINFSNAKVDEYHIDEFDIALLTKSGKFMIFECKSGLMSGDVAKSTKYSTYAISGVYGTPVLITPLLKDEILNINKLEKEVYGYIKSAVLSAKRASLEIWGLDEIEDKLKEIIK